MKKILLSLTALTGLMFAGSVMAQTQTQCVTNAVAGGTVDALTVPLLPCGLATNILILTIAGSNLTTTPTLQMSGFPAQRIYTNTLADPGIGDFGGAGSVLMLASTGTSWLVINGNVGGYIPLPLSVANGGTGAATFTSHGVLYGNTTGAVGVTAAGTTGQYLKGSTGAAPLWGTLASDTVSTVGFGSTGLTPSAATAGAVTVAGTLGFANGGTSNTSYTDGQLLIGNSGTGGLSKATLTAGTNVTITNASGGITITSTGLASGCGTSPNPSGYLITSDGSGACTSNSNATFLTGTISLGINSSQAGAIKLFGSTSGNLTVKAAAAAGSSTILTLPGGTTDFSATGGTNQVVKQASAGGAFTVGTIACAGLSDGATGCSTTVGTAATQNTGTSGATIPFLNGANTWSGTNTYTAQAVFSGASTTLAASLVSAKEPALISATAATGTINYDICTQSIIYYTSSAAANWTVNFRCSAGTTLNTAMNTGDIVTVTFLVTQGASPFYNNAVQVDTGAVTPKYQGGTAWSAGNASSIDAYTYAITKTANATFTVFASQTQFK